MRLQYVSDSVAVARPCGGGRVNVGAVGVQTLGTIFSYNLFIVTMYGLAPAEARALRNGHRSTEFIEH